MVLAATLLQTGTNPACPLKHMLEKWELKEHQNDSMKLKLYRLVGIKRQRSEVVVSTFLKLIIYPIPSINKGPGEAAKNWTPWKAKH